MLQKHLKTMIKNAIIFLNTKKKAFIYVFGHELLHKKLYK